MKVLLADRLGFCMGVKNSVDILLDTTNKHKEVYCYGEIAHNKQLINHLENKGVIIAKNTSEIPEKSVVIIRSHGCTPDVIDSLNKKNCEVIDTTCGSVKSIQLLVKKLEEDGWQVVIFGSKDHPEVEGIVANTKNALDIDSVNDAKNLGFFEKIALVSKTTKKKSDYDSLSEEIERHCKEFKRFDTICGETELRQKAAECVAKQSDIVIVVGGFHSSNTQSLASLCSRITDTYHIETPDQIKQEWFKGKETIGITAGASTPNSLMKDVVSQVEEFGKQLR